MTKYRVTYSSMNLYELVVDAENEEEARQIARDADGAEFEQAGMGDWEYHDIAEVPHDADNLGDMSFGEYDA